MPHGGRFRFGGLEERCETFHTSSIRTAHDAGDSKDRLQRFTGEHDRDRSWNRHLEVLSRAIGDSTQGFRIAPWANRASWRLHLGEARGRHSASRDRRVDHRSDRLGGMRERSEPMHALSGVRDPSRLGVDHEPNSLDARRILTRGSHKSRIPAVHSRGDRACFGHAAQAARRQDDAKDLWTRSNAHAFP